MASLAEALAYNSGKYGNRLAAADETRFLTWADLAAVAYGFAQGLGSEPGTVGILGRNSLDWVIAFLGASIAGKTIVPIPPFFSESQCAHIIRDAGIERVIVSDEGKAGAFPVPFVFLKERRGEQPPALSRDGGLIIYTSGSTGSPKGVKLQSGQALWSAETLARAISAGPEDKYLSVLPFPLLLELICGIIIPVLAGGAAHYETSISDSVGAGVPCNIAEAFWRVRPTTSVLVPQLLALLTMQLMAENKHAPSGLRFVAAGGAAVPAALARNARLLGIPVYEGYGLSECASVVAVNTPERSAEGTVGRPLPGLEVTIEDGEIVVEGPSVMDGYLHDPVRPRRWRTGDVGSFDSNGFLTILGRKDNLIVTPYGRNLSPEWIETLVLGDPRVGACVLSQTGEPQSLVLLLIPSPLGEGWFRNAKQEAVADLISAALKDAPVYARPQRATVLSREEAFTRNLYTANGRPRRSEVQRYLHDRALTFEVQE